MKTIQITKAHKSFAKIKWLSKAISKDPTRPALHFIHVESDGDELTLVTIDGRRMHILTAPQSDFPDLTSGDYRLTLTAQLAILTEDTGGLNFPNWGQVIPKYDTHPKQDEVIRESIQVEKNACVSKATGILNASNTGKHPIMFNDTFLSDALGYGTLFAAKGKHLWGCQTVEMSPLLMTSDAGDLKAVVMPCRA